MMDKNLIKDLNKILFNGFNNQFKQYLKQGYSEDEAFELTMQGLKNLGEK